MHESQKDHSKSTIGCMQVIHHRYLSVCVGKEISFSFLAGRRQLGCYFYSCFSLSTFYIYPNSHHFNFLCALCSSCLIKFMKPKHYTVVRIVPKHPCFALASPTWFLGIVIYPCGQFIATFEWLPFWLRNLDRLRIMPTTLLFHWGDASHQRRWRYSTKSQQVWQSGVGDSTSFYFCCIAQVTFLLCS